MDLFIIQSLLKSGSRFGFLSCRLMMQVCSFKSLDKKSTEASFKSTEGDGKPTEVDKTCTEQDGKSTDLDEGSTE